MSENLEHTKEAFKALAKLGLEAEYGEAKGKAIAFLLFGGYGHAGLIGDAELVVEAGLSEDPKAVAENFTKEAASGLAIDLSVKLLAVALERAGISISTYIGVAGAFFSAFLKPSEIGVSTLPDHLVGKPAKNPPELVPGVQPKPSDPDAPSPKHPSLPKPAPTPPKPIPKPDQPDPPEPDEPDPPEPDQPDPPEPDEPDPPEPQPPIPMPLGKNAGVIDYADEVKKLWKKADYDKLS